MQNNLTYCCELDKLGISIHTDTIDRLVTQINQAVSDGKIRKHNELYSIVDFLREVLEYKSGGHRTWYRFPNKYKITHLVSSFEFRRSDGISCGKDIPVTTVEGLLAIAGLLNYDRKHMITRKQATEGSIYVLKDAGNDALKVGFTSNLKSRIKAHKTSHPFLELIYCFGVNSIAAESALHKALKAYRVKGSTEWYWLKPKTLAIIEAFAAVQMEYLQPIDPEDIKR